MRRHCIEAFALEVVGERAGEVLFVVYDQDPLSHWLSHYNGVGGAHVTNRWRFDPEQAPRTRVIGAKMTSQALVLSRGPLVAAGMAREWHSVFGVGLTGGRMSSAWFVLGLSTAWILLGLRVLIGATRRRGEPAGSPEDLPGVSVLKPLAGADPELEANLESFFLQDHPRFELLFGVEEPSDPAIAVVERVRARHPTVRARVIIHAGLRAQNPKISNLSGIIGEAAHDLVLVSDSNIRAPTDYVRSMAALSVTAGPRFGLATNLFVGSGERSVGAALEAVQLNGFVAAGALSFRVATGVVGVHLFRKSVLGSWAAGQPGRRDGGGLRAREDVPPRGLSGRPLPAGPGEYLEPDGCFGLCGAAAPLVDAQDSPESLGFCPGAADEPAGDVALGLRAQRSDRARRLGGALGRGDDPDPRRRGVDSAARLLAAAFAAAPRAPAGIARAQHLARDTLREEPRLARASRTPRRRDARLQSP
jgi:hypothetical protein